MKLILEYDGRGFNGWQRQPRLRTVQGELERALLKITRTKTHVIAAGRTDAGVHARAQVVNFKTSAGLDPREWVRALNYYLPDDIAVLSARRVSDQFNARRSASGKTYRYRVRSSPVPSAIDRDFLWQLDDALNLRAMKSAARRLTGRHDYSSFQVGRAVKIKKGGSASAWCTIRELRITRRGPDITFIITGDRFLQQMVRSLVGTLIEVGRGKIKPGAVAQILKKKDRRFAGPTAPARGLSLDKVDFS